MDNFAIRHRVDEIRAELKANAATFVLDDSAKLISEWMNLQRVCSHIRHDGISFFDIAEYHTCPICDMTRESMKKGKA